MFRVFCFSILFFCWAIYSSAQQKTYCNPINLDYGYSPIPNFTTWGNHRTTADPAMVNYKGDFYLFSTNQTGYWWSHDMSDWHFVSRHFLEEKVIQKIDNKWDDLCAPAAWVQGDSLCVFGSTYSSLFPIWTSTNPKGNQWSKAVEEFEIGGWDPDFFVDDDGKLYMYNGSSNQYPLYGIELDRTTFKPKGTRKELLLLDDAKIGWHRFGEHADNTFMRPFIEGAWMTKHDGKYYLQWGGPGTEFSHYGDGVAIGNSPLGTFEHQSLPLSLKAGGFARGAGHGSTFQDNTGSYWHISSMTINVKNNFERRLGMWSAGFDKDGVMFCNTAFGDYPHYLASPNPSQGGEKLTHDNLSKDRKNDTKSHAQIPSLEGERAFTGWMLLNYNKPVQVSSTFGSFSANQAVDESIKTYWCAASGNKGEWFVSDLGATSTVYAVQINYADQDAEFRGKQLNIFHQYQVLYSLDGKSWKILIDKSKNTKDVPHDYVELSTPVKARYLKMINWHMPTGKFALSGFRVFGLGTGEKPKAVEQFIVLRSDQTDRRNAWIKWKPVDNAYAYNIYAGTSPDKLYNCTMVYNANEYYYPYMDSRKPYYFAIEAINENGCSEWTRAEGL